jgi:hypothetical protein
MIDANAGDRDVDNVQPPGNACDPLVSPERRNGVSDGPTASNKVAAVTSTEWVWPLMSRIVTRQERTCIKAKYHIRFWFATSLRC